MFRKVLVANRGEIALRIICACKELQIQTVAVYSEADRHSLHVRFADEAICIGPAKSQESYLNIPSIISAAEIADVDAIHPGYGYLAESSYFAEVCETCGIKFIGPPAGVIELMGDKTRARKRMKEAGLPILPGTSIIEETDVKLEQIAEEVGHPIILKAAAGGGGKGMRVVTKTEQLHAALATAQSEAESAFGNSAIYIERYMEKPRHIELQILADQHGNVIHLGERECTIQRRHQKLVEESPSPIVSEELRQELGEKVVQAMKAIDYQNAGTVEFLFDQDGSYYFLEMNTRVQVEHPVTEMVTGLDIVKEQIRAAFGEKLRFSQKDILFCGHSIECRINAESPEDFTPSPGTITAYHPPGGPGIRVDSAAYTEYQVTSHYDSLIAKLIAHGRDRQEALARMNRALDLFVIEGIQTSIPLHKKIINHPDFVNGQFDTSFLDQLAS
ncbi:MAG: acetyl-CoA carboxylase biotin carboxylase subunit [Acidobacteria bacterium]|nr:acetyl-CoA carboxylase biotin carboxylase subunit [Acidobacteriota bacterium]